MPTDRDDLARSLERATRAFGPRGAPRGGPGVPRTAELRKILGGVGTGLGVGSVSLAVLSFVTGSALLAPAAILGLGAVVVFGVRFAAPLLLPGVPRDPNVAHVGLGAEVDTTARIEHGGAVEMGATVGAGSVVQSGAVVRMGATVGRDVVVESGAVVGWGATVQDGAVVRQGAGIGAGATVEAGAVVEAGMHVFAGATVRAERRDGRAREPLPPKPVARPEPRAERIDTLCDRLETELRGSSTRVREFLGSPEKTVAALRTTCHEILARETGLRQEAKEESVAKLREERATIEARANAADDDVIRRSLHGALAAIDEQLRQRALLERNADRLDAEFTRLLYTLEGLLAQVIRLRSEGGAGGDAALETTVTQLRDELNAVADAVESVTRDERAALLSYAEPPAAPVPEPGEAVPTRRRERE